MRRILVVDDDPHICLAIRAWLQRLALRLGATRCLRKPFRPKTLLSVIDQCLSEAEPHRRYVATLAVITNALSEKSTHEPREDVLAD
jgi:DNA-binding response OmpR family regulator